MLDFTLRQVEKKARARGMCMCEWELDRLEGGDVVGFGWGRGCEREGGGDGLRGLGSVLSETMGWAGKRVKEGRLSWIFFARFPRSCGGVAGAVGARDWSWEWRYLLRPRED